ncbi:hypothetical protein K1719_009224 [Acacia pycnantha]|nr:hypothetical protein K1719_009224 [Acacia pycnantha]
MHTCINADESIVLGDVPSIESQTKSQTKAKREETVSFWIHPDGEFCFMLWRKMTCPVLRFYEAQDVGLVQIQAHSVSFSISYCNGNFLGNG